MRDRATVALLYAGALALVVPVASRGERAQALLIALLAVLLVLHWAGRSLPRLALVGVAGVIAGQLLLLPSMGLVAATLAQTTLLVVLTARAMSTIRQRGAPAGRLGALSAIFPLLATITTVLGWTRPANLSHALLFGAVLFFGSAITASLNKAESTALLGGLTRITAIAALIGLYETWTGAPVYEFTSFQLHESSKVVFRASSILGHPLILATFCVAIALANIAARYVGTRSGTGYWLGVALPLAGALATQSRSIVVMAVVGLAALLALSQSAGARRSPGRLAILAVFGLVGTGIYFIVGRTDSGLARRFQDLSLEEQRVRVSGFEVVGRVTEGWENAIGGGPRAVQQASGSDLAVTFSTVDNQYLTTYADSGLVGVMALGLLVWWIARAIWRQSTPRHQVPMLVAGAVVIGTALLADVLAWTPTALLFSMAVGGALQPDHPKESHPGLRQPSDRPNPRPLVTQRLETPTGPR